MIEPAAPWLSRAAVGVVTLMTRPGLDAEEFLTVTAVGCSEQDVLVLRVAGEVDLSTLGQLREHLQQVPGAHRAVVLDCTDVSFLAACGIGLLVEMAEQAHAQRMTVRLVAEAPLVLRALEVAGVDGVLPRAGTVAEAVTQCAL